MDVSRVSASCNDRKKANTRLTSIGALSSKWPTKPSRALTNHGKQPLSLGTGMGVPRGSGVGILPCRNSGRPCQAFAGTEADLQSAWQLPHHDFRPRHAPGPSLAAGTWLTAGALPVTAPSCAYVTSPPTSKARKRSEGQHNERLDASFHWSRYRDRHRRGVRCCAQLGAGGERPDAAGGMDIFRCRVGDGRADGIRHKNTAAFLLGRRHIKTLAGGRRR